jgi:hypothetical protein
MVGGSSTKRPLLPPTSEDRRPAQRRLAQLFRRHRMDGADGRDHVVAAHPVVARGDDGIETVEAHERVLDMRRLHPAAAGLAHRRGERGGDLAATDHDIRPGRIEALAAFGQPGQGVQPEATRQALPGPFGPHALEDRFKAQGFGEAAALGFEAGLARGHDPADGRHAGRTMRAAPVSGNTAGKKIPKQVAVSGLPWNIISMTYRMEK